MATLPLSRLAAACALFMISTGLHAAIVINEIHYDPASATSREAFIELINAGEDSVDLSGWRFSEGVDFVFPAGTILAANALLVVAEDPAGLLAAYGQNALGPWSGRLRKSGERITLRDADGGVIDRVDFAAGFPWPSAPRGGGSSAELIDPSLDNDLGGSWRAAGAVEAPAESITYIAAGETGWRYRLGTSEPPSDWQMLGFREDASWLTGQTSIGYADGDDATQITGMSGNYTSLYFRKDFTVPEGPLPAQLALRVYVDDGAIISINGTEVARFAVSPGVKAFDGLAENHEAVWEQELLSNVAALLRPGVNVVTAHGMNSSFTSSDFSFDLELRTPLPGQSSGTPTPGAENSVRADGAPPQTRQVEHLPESPKGGEAVQVSAKVTDPDGVASVTLRYQVVEPGNYVRKTDAAYESSWQTLAMTDEDADAVYEASIPAGVQRHRRLIRYRIDVADSGGSATAIPYADDEQPNFAYFVYDGAPAWRGAFRPGQTPVQTFPADLMDDLPIYQLLAVEEDVVASQYDSAADGRHMLGALVYDGVVYDHIEFENRGEASTYQSGKNKWRFHFNRARSFQARDTWGRKYGSAWNKLSLDACASPWAAVNRGMAGLDEAVSYRLYGLAGVPSSRTHHLHFRVIDDVSEASASDQYAGDLWGLYLAVEDPDGSFLDDRDLPDGNVYKIEGGSGDKKHQGPTQPTSSSDWNAFRDATSLQTESWWRENMDVTTYYSYRACDRITGNVDLRPGSNHYFYHHPDGRWVPLPWDLDMMFISETHWPGVIDQEVCLQHANIALEYRNRSREMLDLICDDPTPNGGQIGQLIDEYAQLVNPSGQALTWADLDAAMWNMHPQTRGNANTHSGQTNHKGQFYYTPFGDSRFGGSWTRRLDSASFEGFVKYLVDYTTDTFPGNSWEPGNGNQLGYGYEYLKQEAQDNGVPDRPVITYAGGSDFPVNDLRFGVSAFSDPQGGLSFAAVEWRLAEIAAPGVGVWEPGTPRRYEIEATWQSGEITSQERSMKVPSLVTRAGHVYRVRARYRDTTHRWSHWSSAIQFTAAVPDLAALGSQLQLTEVMVQPADPSEAESALGYSASDFEYIELRNGGDESLELTDVRFTKGIDFDFPAGFQLGAGEYVLVVANEMAFRQRYGGQALIAGSYGPDKLSNEGETLKLSFGAGAAIHEITYGNAEPWPLSLDRLGYSMVLVQEPTADLSDASNWRQSAAVGGSPGAADGEVMIPRFAVSVSMVGPGTVDREPLEDTYEEGAELTLTATPDEEARFVEWTGDVSGNENPLVVTVTADLTVAAVFERVLPPWEVWQVDFFGESSAEAAPDRDPDGDGVANLVEYAQGTHPRNAADVRVTRVSPLASGGVSLSFPWRGIDPSVGWQLEQSATLTAWSPVEAVVVDEDGMLVVTIPQSEEALFVRLRVWLIR